MSLLRAAPTANGSQPTNQGYEVSRGRVSATFRIFRWTFDCLKLQKKKKKTGRRLKTTGTREGLRSQREAEGRLKQGGKRKERTNPWLCDAQTVRLSVYWTTASSDGKRCQSEERRLLSRVTTYKHSHRTLSLQTLTTAAGAVGTIRVLKIFIKCLKQKLTKVSRGVELCDIIRLLYIVVRYNM